MEEVVEGSGNYKYTEVSDLTTALAHELCW